MSVAVIVESYSDKDVVEVLLGKRGIRPIVRFMRGNDPDRASTIANDLLRCGVRTIVVLKDLHCTEAPVEKMKEKLRSLISQGFVRLIIVKQSIEAWLLSDPSALKGVFRCSAEVANPEGIHKPDEELDRIAMRCGSRYYKRPTARRLAEAMNVDRASSKCESLRAFLSAL